MILLWNWRTGESEKLFNSVNFKDLIYHFKGPTKDIDFNNFIDAETVFDDTKLKKIRFEDVEKNQREFESELSSVRIGGNKSNKQLSEKENITKFYKSRKEIIKFHNDYFQVICKAEWKRTQRKIIKLDFKLEC